MYILILTFVTFGCSNTSNSDDNPSGSSVHTINFDKDFSFVKEMALGDYNTDIHKIYKYGRKFYSR